MGWKSATVAINSAHLSMLVRPPPEGAGLSREQFIELGGNLPDMASSQLPRGWLAACKAQLSSGSACGGANPHTKASHVLLAMGHDTEVAANSLRISLPIDADEALWLDIAHIVISAAQQLGTPH